MAKYIDNDGFEYESYEAYCNAPGLDPDILGVMLATKRRIPQNDYEKRLLAEIEKLDKKNIPIEFTFN